MRLIRGLPPAPFISIASGWLLALLPLAALGAEQLLRVFEPGNWRFWAAFGVVQLLWLWGYLASSLPAWAKWDDGTVLDRLTIVQGTFVAALAGNIAYHGGFYYLGLAEIVCFIATSVAAWGGDKFLSPLLQRGYALFGAAPGSNQPKP